MRFISKYGGFKLIVIHEQVERLADGSSKRVAPGFIAEFKHGDLTDWERDFARRVFAWKGVPTAQDGSPLDPINDLHRVSAFDTGMIANAGLRKRVEEAMLADPALGSDFVRVEKPKIAAPWPAYDQLVVHGHRTIEHVVEKVLAGIETTGVDPDAVVAYERQNLNRGEVIDAVEGLRVEKPEDELIVA